MKPSDFLGVFSLVFGLIGLWLVDVGQTNRGVLGNGFFEVPTTIVFHVGIYLALASVITGFVVWFSGRVEKPH